MSADNWAVCPNCLTTARAKLAELAERVATGYGVVPIDEFDAMRTELAKGIDEEALRTFREDYEIYDAATGVIKLSYAGGCTNCDAHAERTDEWLVESCEYSAP